MKLKTLLSLVVISASVIAISGCVSSGNKNSTAKTAPAATEQKAAAPARSDQRTANAYVNPEPLSAFNAYGVFELQDLTIAPAYQSHPANKKAAAKIQQEIGVKVQPLLNSWAKSGGKTLIVKPHIEEIKFIGGAARFWAGAFAGKSKVLMSLQLVDKATGKVIAEPEFYQHANAFGGAWSIGATDNNMLVRVVDIMQRYLTENYQEAVGGSTGRE